MVFKKKEDAEENNNPSDIIRLTETPPVRAFMSILKALENNNKDVFEKQKIIKDSFYLEVNSQDTGTMLKSLPIILNAIRVIEYDEIIIRNFSEISVQINVMLKELEKLLSVNESDDESE